MRQFTSFREREKSVAKVLLNGSQHFFNATARIFLKSLSQSQSLHSLKNGAYQVFIKLRWFDRAQSDAIPKYI